MKRVKKKTRTSSFKTSCTSETDASIFQAGPKVSPVNDLKYSETGKAIVAHR